MKILAAVAMVTLGGTVSAGLEQTEVLNGVAHGRVLGRVTTVLDGECTGPRFQKIPENAFLYALGGGALQPDAARQGEGLIVNGRLFIKSLDAACGYCTRTATGVESASGWGAFVAGVDAQALPIARYRLTESTQTMEQVFTELAARHGKLLGVAGVGRFTALETSAIRKAPAYGEPILGPKRADYFHPKAVLRDVDALFFGLVLRSAADETSATQAVFYVNPDDKATSGVQSHTHFATVTSRNGIDPSKPETALGQLQEVAHLLTQSRITSGDLVVYKLENLEPVSTSNLKERE
ncbi:MAG: hypothetical protein ACR2IE_02045 [Candidatus Sumerlaeaceae bacterium]